MSMQTSTWQPSLGMDWTMQHQQYYRHQYPAYQLLALANETPSRVYRRRASRITKPSSAGNSPHSLLPNVPRRRTMTGQSAAHHSLAMMNAALIQQQEKKSRPTSWHPSPSRHAAFHPYSQNCHPSWFAAATAASTSNSSSSSALSEPTLSMPITCPVSGDLISNDSFAMMDQINNNYYGSTMNQAYTPVEPADMIYSGWSSGSMQPMAFPDTLWAHQASTCSSGYLPSDQVADFCCHESVASSDPSTAPVTPDATASYATNSNPPTTYKPDDGQSALSQTADGEDDLVALGLYDEPQTVSLRNGGGLLGGTLLDDSAPPAGKGLKLEETFSPAEEQDDDDADHEDD